MTNVKFVIFKNATFIENAYYNANREIVSLSGQKFSDMKKADPSLDCLDEGSWDYIKDSLPVKEITESEYNSALNMLYPVDWRGVGSSFESFKFAEMLAGAITDIFVEKEGRFFKFADSVHMQQFEIKQRINEFLEQQN